MYKGINVLFIMYLNYDNSIIGIFSILRKIYVNYI